MEQVKNYIFSQVAAKKVSPEQAKVLLKEIHRFSNSEGAKSRDIAVIGIACRFPGADSCEEYWELMKKASGSLGDFPEKRRKDTDAFLQHAVGAGTVKYRKGGYLKEIDGFDPLFFRISPREAELMDPAQRLFLEVAWEAIENSGLGERRIAGTRTGVYVGRDTSNGSQYKNDAGQNEGLAQTGSITSILASRLSYTLDLKGPGMVVDTACSSGLAALHNAIKAINSNEIDYAVVGGVSISYMPTQSGMVDSLSGKVSTFDKSADGTVWGEGVGAVVIMPLDRALKARNSIYAVIKGSAVNNDGASNGLTAPRAEAQADVIRRAWDSAGINPETISYIEAHGTGTKLGDPIEVKGITDAFKAYTERKQFCGIGTVKTAIGHLEGASGIAALIKMVLALRHGMIPASLNFNQPNPYISFPESPVYVVNRPTEWRKEGGPRRCGVSSFGFSGTNCHVVLEEAPERIIFGEKSTAGLKIFTLSAKSEKSLRDMAVSYKTFLDMQESVSIEDICYTVNTGRGHYNFRIAVPVENITELKNALRKIAEDFSCMDNKAAGIFCKRHEIVMNKVELQEGEMSEEQKVKLTQQANTRIKEQMDEYGLSECLAKEICELYVEGADIEWELLYKSDSLNILNLPVYCFERKRFWIESSPGRGESRSIHPLLDKLIAKTLNQYIFETVFSADRQWVLSEHRISGANVVPGTTYIEMAAAAARACTVDNDSVLRNVRFYKPMVVPPGESRVVHTIIEHRNGGIYFKIASTLDEDALLPEGKWTLYAEGELGITPHHKPENFEIEKILPHMGEEIAVMNEDGGLMSFGPRWQCAKGIRLGDSGALVSLELMPGFSKDTEVFGLHPALLDMATSFGYSRLVGGEFFLPFSYREINIYGQIPSRCYSYIVPKGKSDKDTEILKSDIKILDENYHLVLDIKDFTMKKVRDVKNTIKASLPGKSMLYNIRWQKDSTVRPVKSLSGAVLILIDQLGIGEGMAERYRDLGVETVLVYAGDRFEKTGSRSYTVSFTQDAFLSLIEDVGPESLSAIIHMQSMVKNDAVDCIEQMDEAEKRNAYSLMYLIKALAKRKSRENIDICLVTQNANEVTGKEDRINPHQSLIIGMGKAINSEYNNLKVRCIDIDGYTAVDTLFEELARAEAQDYCAAYRNNDRYVEVLHGVDPGESGLADTAIKSEGIYIVSGGTGGIGLEICKYLSTLHSASFALVSRSVFPEPSGWDSIIEQDNDKRTVRKIKTIKEIEKNGSRVICVSGDVSKKESLEPVIANLRKEFGRINGIIHSAGNAGSGYLAGKDETVFSSVLDPKVKGTWLLDRLTREDDPDFFIMFSSNATFLGGIGQADYAAANSYLDSFCAFRSRQGKRTLTINWPAWRETGMAVDYGVNRDMIFKAIDTDDALDAFDKAIKSGFSRVVVFEFNKNTDLPLDVLTLRLSEDLLNEFKKSVRDNKRIENTGAVKDLPAGAGSVAVDGKHKGDYTETEMALAQIWGAVMKLDRIDIYKSLYDLSGDSILATQMLIEMGKYFEQQLDISDIFSYPSVAEMAKHLDGLNVKDVKAQEGQSGDKKAAPRNIQETDLKKMLDGLKKGELSIKSSLDILKNKKRFN